LLWEDEIIDWSSRHKAMKGHNKRGAELTEKVKKELGDEFIDKFLNILEDKNIYYRLTK